MSPGCCCLTRPSLRLPLGIRADRDQQPETAQRPRTTPDPPVASYCSSELITVERTRVDSHADAGLTALLGPELERLLSMLDAATSCRRDGDLPVGRERTSQRVTHLEAHIGELPAAVGSDLRHAIGVNPQLDRLARLEAAAAGRHR